MLACYCLFGLRVIKFSGLKVCVLRFALNIYLFIVNFLISTMGVVFCCVRCVRCSYVMFALCVFVCFVCLFVVVVGLGLCVC